MNYSLFDMKALLFLFLLLPFINLAQRAKQNVVYDVVKLKTGQILYGKMLSMDNNYVLTFKDQYNRTYILSKEMYEYIEEDRNFTQRVKMVDSLVNPRKINEFDFHVGLNTLFAGVDAGFKPDNNYVSSNSNGMFYEMPICLSLGAGKYFQRQHYVGASLDFKAIGGPNRFSQYSANYRFLYDRNKSNTARYIPITLGFQNLTTEETFQAAGLTLPPLPVNTDKTFETNVSSLHLGIGHGFSFIGKDLHYFNLEILLYKGLWAKHSIISNELTLPNLNYQTAGAQLKLSYHF
jgi:hypothetical protein